MHLPDGSTSPMCAVIGVSVAAMGIGLLWLDERRHPDRTPAVDKRDVVTAYGLVLALQALQVPVVFASYAVHMLGGAFLAWRLGSVRGVGVMAAVLATQAALFGDGAWSAFGVHLFAMGVIPVALVRLLGRSPRVVALAAATSVLVASAVVGLAATSGSSVVWTTVVSNHLSLIVLECAVTLALVVGERLIPRVGIAAALASLALWGNARPDGLMIALGSGTEAVHVGNVLGFGALLLGSMVMFTLRRDQRARSVQGV